MRRTTYALAFAFLASACTGDGALGSNADADTDCGYPVDTEPCAAECACTVALDDTDGEWMCVPCPYPENCGDALVWWPRGDVLSCEP